jgi:dolichyl-phosphate beta-glucosyltransferase
MREVCLVVPCFNEERRLRSDRIREFLGSSPGASICFVNDGSSDDTRTILETLRSSAPDRLMVLNLTHNGGKAEAVRQGIMHAASLGRFAFVGYWDADLATPLHQVDHLLLAFDADAVQMALGCRVKRLGSDIDRRAIRHYLGRVFSTFASQLLDLPVYDSQCGAKLFRSPITSALFQEPFVTNWSFDLEILVRLRKHLGRAEFLKAAAEVPLTAWHEVGQSKMTLGHMLGMPIEVIRIRRTYGV